MENFQDFFVTRILCEINFGKSRSSKTADFAIFGALNFVDLVNFSLLRVQKFIKSKKLRASKYVKMADFETLKLPTLISRKMRDRKILLHISSLHRFYVKSLCSSFSPGK